MTSSRVNGQSARTFGRPLPPVAMPSSVPVPPNARRLRRTGPLAVPPALRSAGRLTDPDRTVGGAPFPVVGSEAIADRLVSQLRTATGDVYWLRCGEEPDVSILDTVAAAVDASRVRILLHGGDQPVPQSLAGAELRFTGARAGHDFLLIGDDIAYVFDRDEHGRPVMTPVLQASVAKAFLSIFEYLWVAAPPAVADIQQELSSEARRIIIRMLGDGATDDAIARTLGISRRTIARHVAQIMHCTGTLSRFQTGMRLAQLGLLAGGR